MHGVSSGDGHAVASARVRACACAAGQCTIVARELAPFNARKAAGGAHGSPVTLPIEPRNPHESNSGPVCRVYMTCELPNLRGSEELFGGIGFFIRKTRHAREGLCK